VDDGVDPGAGDDLADQRVADVGADELGSAQFGSARPARGNASMPMTRSIDDSPLKVRASWALR